MGFAAISLSSRAEEFQNISVCFPRCRLDLIAVPEEMWSNSEPNFFSVSNVSSGPSITAWKVLTKSAPDVLHPISPREASVDFIRSRNAFSSEISDGRRDLVRLPSLVFDFLRFKALSILYRFSRSSSAESFHLRVSVRKRRIDVLPSLNLL